jgi:thiol-disulfide isomerase/thioredoxin
MKTVLLIACTCLTFQLSGQGIHFQEITLDEALRQAGEQEKLVFIDCYTSWCGPCKHMANVEFPKEQAGAFFNPRFVNVKFDMERGEGMAIAARFAVNIFPTFLILRPDGSELNRVIGAVAIEPFIEKVDAAIAPRNSLPAMIEEHAAGTMGKERMTEFIFVLKNAYRDSLAAVVTDDLMGHLTDAEKISPEYWPIFKNQKINSKHFLFLLDHLADFERVVGKEEVATLVKGFRGLDHYLATSQSYREGNRDKRFLLDHAQALSFSPLKAREIAGELLHALSRKEKADTTYWPIFHLLTFSEWGTEPFNYLLARRADFYRTKGQHAVDGKIHHCYVHKVMMIVKGYDKGTTDADFDRMEREARRYRLDGVVPLVAMTRAYQHRDAPRLLEACRAAFPLFDDNLALNIAQPLVNFLKTNLPASRQADLRQLVSDMSARVKSDTVKGLLSRLIA